MPVTINTKIPTRKLVAVIGVNGKGLYIRNPSGKGVIYLFESGNTIIDGDSLESFANTIHRTSVYEGDEVTIKFV